ncbi:MULTISPECIES: sensor domain-containing diguanylate cyclase [Aphanothece]|uniref:sensor domain-containing diguanylate cyclase n=1 Tax=Aphanothece TaxID=1121 RepID=UPI003984F197
MYPDYPLPRDEQDRQRDLEGFGVLDHPGDAHFDRLVRLASTVLETPIALISLIDKNRQWFLARHGLEVSETPREAAFCAHAIVGGEPMVVTDARNDPRFCNNPLVVDEPGIRFYAGAPLASPEGHNLGTLCVIDRVPRNFSSSQVKLLQDLADLVVRELDLRRGMRLCPLTGLANRTSFLEQGQREVNRALEGGLPMALLLIDIDQFSRINNRWGHQAGDQVLRDVAEVCRSQRRPQDLVGRLRDDQFAMLMVNTDPEAAMERAEAVRSTIADLSGVFTSSGEGLYASGGLTELTPADRRIEDLLGRAGQALLLAQSSGREHQIARLVSEPGVRPSADGPGGSDGWSAGAGAAGRRSDDPGSSRRVGDPGR